MTDDLSRQAATSPDEYTLTIDEALARYEHAGHPRTSRSIQRYCAKGHLDCLRQETSFGEKYLITPVSIARHIAQIAELASTTGRDVPRHVASDVAGSIKREEPEQEAGPRHDQSRHVAADDRYVQLLESENKFLRDQVRTKDDQIRQGNILTQGLQRLIAGLTGSPDPAADPGDSRQIETIAHKEDRTGSTGPV
jgi:hypothetical protein